MPSTRFVAFSTYIHLVIANVQHIQIKLNYQPVSVNEKPLRPLDFLLAMPISLSAHYLWFWTKYIANKEKIDRRFYVHSKQTVQSATFRGPQLPRRDSSSTTLFFALWILAFYVCLTAVRFYVARKTGFPAPAWVS